MNGVIGSYDRSPSVIIQWSLRDICSSDTPRVNISLLNISDIAVWSWTYVLWKCQCAYEWESCDGLAMYPCTSPFLKVAMSIDESLVCNNQYIIQRISCFQVWLVSNDKHLYCCISYYVLVSGVCALVQQLLPPVLLFTCCDAELLCTKTFHCTNSFSPFLHVYIVTKIFIFA